MILVRTKNLFQKKLEIKQSFTHASILPIIPDEYYNIYLSCYV